MWIFILIPALIGLVVFGPFGMFFGACLGMLWGPSLFSSKRSLFSRQENAQKRINVQQLFFKTTFVVMGRLAKADGRINELEIQQATQLMESMQLSVDMKKQAINWFNRGKIGLTDFRQLLIQFRETITSVNLLHVFLEVQLQIACADGLISSAERKVLLEICQLLHVSPVVLGMLERRVLAQHHFQWHSFDHHEPFYKEEARGHDHKIHYASAVELKKAYEVLGVTRDASEQVIKRTYRKLMSAHHPDKLVAKGLPKEMLEMAKCKTQDIQAAYDVVQKNLRRS